MVIPNTGKSMFETFVINIGTYIYSNSIYGYIVMFVKCYMLVLISAFNNR